MFEYEESPTQEKKNAPVGNPRGGWRGLVWASLLFSAGSGVAALLYGTQVYGAGSVLLTILGLQLLLVTVSSFLALHAGRLREKQAEIAQWKKPEWGEDTENPYKIEFDQGKILHFLVFGVLPTLLLAICAGYVMYYGTQPDKIRLVSASHSVLAAILTMVCCILWLVLARSYDAVSSLGEKDAGDSLPESQALGEAAWESCWWMGLASLVLLVKSFFPVFELVLFWCVAWWILAVSVEQTIRLFYGWMKSRHTEGTFVSPITVFLRYMVFVRGNPINSLFYTLEERWGVSFRSSWAIRFVAKATLPAMLMVLLLWWGLSSLYVVRVNEFGVRRDCGRIHFEPLQPGLHVKLPWPFGSIVTYPVKQVSMMPIGYEQTGSGQFLYLWTKAHENEFELVLGDGKEAVAVNAMVHYKIREDHEGFFQYVLNFQNPSEAINAYAHRALTELTRTSTLEQVLATERDRFAAEIQKRLQGYLDENRMGVEIVEVAMLNLHPPVKVAGSYLDVISAGVNARQYEIVEEGRKAAAVFEAQEQSEQIVADAKVRSAEMVAQAGAETAEFLAAGKSYDVNPECFQLRYWLDNIQDVLRNKRLVLVDQSVDIYFDMQKNNSPDASRNAIMRAE
ncbi:MAG: SPFH domain-containing protein [Planctomycetia bacterium]|nr:SPFH domain-containing protein [Planctomycetia bacterium]